MRNVLLIAYEFPPSAGGGVLRLAKFARYLHESGWRPTVVCSEPIWGRPVDESLLLQVADVEVVRLRARDGASTIARAIAPLKALRPARRATQATDEAVGADGAQPPRGRTAAEPLSSRLARRRWLDSAEPWARRLPAQCARLHERTPFDAILVSGPPPSVMIAAEKAAGSLGLPLVVDLRDAWAGRADFRRSDSSEMERRSLAGERAVMSRASAALAVSEPIAAEVAEFGCADVTVVPNGFDADDLPEHRPAEGPLTIAFMGRFYDATDPTPFLAGMAEAVRGGADVVLEIAGPPAEAVRAYARGLGLEGRVRFHGFLPHAQALQLVASSDVALVSIAPSPAAEGIYTGKLFEYLGIGVPVLVVGPSRGAAARVVRDADAGRVVEHGDSQAVARALLQWSDAKVRGLAIHGATRQSVAQFDRKVQVREVARVLDRAVESSAS